MSESSKETDEPNNSQEDFSENENKNEETENNNQNEELRSTTEDPDNNRHDSVMSIDSLVSVFLVEI